MMKAVVLESWPDDRVSSLSGIGVNSDIPARWENIKNANPRMLAPGEVVEFECRRDANGKSFYANIRVLTGRAERDALNTPALRPKFDERFAPHRVRRGR